MNNISLNNNPINTIKIVLEYLDTVLPGCKQEEGRFQCRDEPWQVAVHYEDNEGCYHGEVWDGCSEHHMVCWDSYGVVLGSIKNPAWDLVKG